METRSDIELVKELKNGDKGVFMELFDRFNGKIYNLALRLTGSREDSFDISQETFFKIYTNIGQLKDDSAFFSWGYSIAVNLARGKYKKQADTVGIKEHHAADSGKKDESELKEIVEKGLNKIHPNYREIIILYEYEGLSYEEISKVLACPVNSVKVSLHRAREALKKALEPYREILLEEK